MRAAGLKDLQITRLALLKEKVDAGKIDDLTPEYRRLTFMRWLCQTGQLRD